MTATLVSHTKLMHKCAAQQTKETWRDRGQMCICEMCIRCASVDMEMRESVPVSEHTWVYLHV